METRDHKDFLDLPLMRNLVGKEALRVLNGVLRRILALSDKMKRFKGRVLIKINMQVRREKVC